MKTSLYFVLAFIGKLCLAYAAANTYTPSDLFIKVMRNSHQERLNSTRPRIKSEQTSNRKPTDAETTEAMLRFYHQNLRSFFGSEVFDVSGFESQRIEFEDRLGRVKQSLDSSCLHNETFMDELHFIALELHTMIKASKAIRIHEASTHIASKLICMIYNLNVKILGFFDTRGRPDLSLKNLPQDVQHFVRRIYYWKMIFPGEEVQNSLVTKEMKLEFSKQIRQAERSLDFLMKFTSP